MKYVTYEYFLTLYDSDYLPESAFNRLGWIAEREVDKATSGIDNVPKLQIAFPKNKYDAEAVRRCVCSVIEFLSQIESANKSANLSLNGNKVSSVSAGNESINYVTGKTVDSSVSVALGSHESKEKETYSLIKSMLSGICDSNGVSLLYTGRYPYIVEV